MISRQQYKARAKVILEDMLEVIYVFRNREAAKILIDFLFLLNLGFSSRHPLAAVCSI